MNIESLFAAVMFDRTSICQVRLNVLIEATVEEHREPSYSYIPNGIVPKQQDFISLGWIRLQELLCLMGGIRLIQTILALRLRI